MATMWNARHYAHHSLIQEDFAHKALSAISIKPQDAILDIGCGDGKITAYMAQQAYTGKTLGIDACENMILHAQKNYANLAHTKFKHIPAQEISFEQEFDIITCFNCFHWVKEQQKTLIKIAHALKPKGKFLLLAFADKQEPLLQAIYKVLTTAPWSNYTSKAQTAALVISDKNQLQDMVTAAELSILTNTTVTIGPYKASKDMFRQWLAGWLFSLLPQTAELTQEIKDLFLGQVIDTYLALNGIPAQAQELLLSASELLLIAQKNS